MCMTCYASIWIWIWYVHQSVSQSKDWRFCLPEFFQCILHLNIRSSHNACNGNLAKKNGSWNIFFHFGLNTCKLWRWRKKKVSLFAIEMTRFIGQYEKCASTGTAKATPINLLNLFSKCLLVFERARARSNQVWRTQCIAVTWWRSHTHSTQWRSTQLSLLFSVQFIRSLCLI